MKNGSVVVGFECLKIKIFGPALQSSSSNLVNVTHSSTISCGGEIA